MPARLRLRIGDSFNILARDRRDTTPCRPAARVIDRASSWVLAFAYVISVTYYLRLFGSFALSLTPFDDAVHGQIATTAVLIFIGGYGFARGLRALENLEEVTVSIKLAIIAGLLAGLAVHVGVLAHGHVLPGNGAPALDWRSVTVGFGLLITVQGFETSRYLGAAYDAKTRVRTMRNAQFIASAIYIVFITLTTLAFPIGTIGTRETAVIQMTQVVAPVLPVLLVVAALASQFSAAVADTNGCGGLIEEVSRRAVPSRPAYLLLAAAAVALVWSANVFEIISYASRAFALYYGLQAALAALLAWRATPARPFRVLLFASLAALGAIIAALGTPAE